MRDNHIINLIEEKPLSSLSQSEIEKVNSHTADCAECRVAYAAARVSFRLLQERASASIEPPPFFQTRVLAAIRERSSSGVSEGNSAPEPYGFRRLWQSARILVTSMAVVVATLTAVTYLTDPAKRQSSLPEVAGGPSIYPTELEILESDFPAVDDLTYSQVLTNLYDTESEGAYGRQQ